ncbi:MAG: twin-arginine translocase subunit TatC [Gammaproteobacteria bacterium]|nr:twin-arginine translocase subunit TatC [Gammaproteobacteria bacterium]
MTDDKVDAVAKESTLISHLVELRSRLLRMTIAVLVIFFALSPFANNIFTMVAGPLLAQMPSGSSMIATRVISPFLTPFKLTLLVAVFLAMPYLLYQAWSFVAPGLYAREKRLVVPLLATSVSLFYAGAAFAYFVVFPLVFKFMQAVAPAGVAVMPDITEYLDFVMVLFFAFGLAFEVPVATVLMVWSGFITPAQLAAKRGYVLLAAFIVGMFLTPPDVISQTLLALPVYVLYEIGIIMARIMVPGHREVEAQRGEQ